MPHGVPEFFYCEGFKDGGCCPKKVSKQYVLNQNTIYGGCCTNYDRIEMLHRGHKWDVYGSRYIFACMK